MTDEKPHNPSSIYSELDEETKEAFLNLLKKQMTKIEINKRYAKTLYMQTFTKLKSIFKETWLKLGSDHKKLKSCFENISHAKKWSRLKKDQTLSFLTLQPREAAEKAEAIFEENKALELFQEIQSQFDNTIKLFGEEMSKFNQWETFLKQENIESLNFENEPEELRLELNKSKEAIIIHLGDSDAYNGIGDIFSSQRRYEDAIKYYDDAITINPNKTIYYKNIVKALIEIDRIKDAIECYKEIKTIDHNEELLNNGLKNILKIQDEEARKEALLLFLFKSQEPTNEGNKLQEQSAMEFYSLNKKYDFEKLDIKEELPQKSFSCIISISTECIITQNLEPFIENADTCSESSRHDNHATNENQSEDLNEIDKLLSCDSEPYRIADYKALLSRISRPPESIYHVTGKNQLEDLNSGNKYLWSQKKKSYTLSLCKKKIRETGEIVVVKRFIANKNENLQNGFNEKQIYEKLANSSTMDFSLKYYGHIYSEKRKNSEIQYKLDLVLEYCENTLFGEMSEMYKRRQAYQNHEIARKFYTLLDLFKNLRESKVNHGDIKPENIFLASSRNFKIGNFDLSKIFKKNETSDHGTKIYEFQGGILNYIAPEVKELYFKCKDNGICSHKGKLSMERCDVYSLGLVFLMMITLKPINGLNEEAHQDKLNERIDNLRLDWTKRLLRKMLAFNYQDRSRFRSALEMLEEDPEFISCFNLSD